MMPVLEQTDKRGASIIHYMMACDLHEVVPRLQHRGLNLNHKVSGTNETPLLIASLCGHEHSVRALTRAGCSLIEQSQVEFDLSNQEQFLQMLNREFPHNLQLEESRLSVPQPLRQRDYSPANSALPRKCGISE